MQLVLLNIYRDTWNIHCMYLTGCCHFGSQTMEHTSDEESANLERANSALTSLMKDVGIGKETGRDRGS